MKSLITATILAAMVFATPAFAESTGDAMAGVGGYSDGYRMGRVTKFSVKGLMMKSGEGEIMLGKESTAWVVKNTDKDGHVTQVVKNPWAFSTSSAAATVIEKYQGQYVWVKYQQAMLASPGRDTEYTVEEITPVTKKAPTCTAESNDTGMKSSGIRTGRIVKASRKGTLAKTYEISLHMSGNQFVDMSITDDKMYSCAVEWLQSGKEVNLHYVQKVFNMSLNDTDYRVVKLVGADDL